MADVTHSIGSSGGGRSRCTIGLAVVQTVADRRGVEQSELPPLYDWVDPEALERIFDAPASDLGGERRFVFDYAGHTITIQQKDRLSITVGEAATEPTAESDSGDESRSDA
ncbi:hypothetical protein CV102_00890 [Natronococcus pandeyae]|uniref:Halobacterial output domain-containing protein n=1 Tax=Natronococcus pandeyae TaxID=2055836 RepID=A0A8J8QA08_9EURY|nr:hypothetical protein CV102_00890 [Natronococcus pandeyae]